MFDGPAKSTRDNYLIRWHILRQLPPGLIRLITASKTKIDSRHLPVSIEVTDQARKQTLDVLQILVVVVVLGS